MGGGEERFPSSRRTPRPLFPSTRGCTAFPFCSPAGRPAPTLQPGAWEFGCFRGRGVGRVSGTPGGRLVCCLGECPRRLGLETRVPGSGRTAQGPRLQRQPSPPLPRLPAGRSKPGEPRAPGRLWSTDPGGMRRRRGAESGVRASGEGKAWLLDPGPRAEELGPPLCSQVDPLGCFRRLGG